MARLGDVARIDRQSVQPESIGDGQLYLGLENIESGGRIVNAGSVRAGELKSAKFAFDERHVLYGKLRPNLAKVARPNFVGVCSTDIVPLLPGPSLDRDYLAHFLVAPSTVDWAASRTAGVNLPRLSPSVLEGLEVPLPPLPEQRRIASILDQASDLVALQRRSILQTAELINSAFIAAFGDPLNSAKHLAAVTLDSICVAIVDCPHTTPIWADEGVVCLRTTNLARGEWSLDVTRYVSEATHEIRVRRATLEPGDIVLSREGTIGVAAIVPEGMRASLGQRLVQVRANQKLVHPEFLLGYLLEVLEPARLSQLLVGSTSQHVNVRDLRNLMVKVPKLSSQLDYATTVSKIRLSLSQRRVHLAKLNELFASLQHRAFRGEL